MITVTPELLDAENERVNLGLLYFGEDIASEIDRWIEFHEDESLDFHRTWEAIALQLPYILEETHPELFGEGAPIKLGEVDQSSLRTPTGLWGQDDYVIMATWTIDGDKLAKLARDDFAIKSVHDGYGASGFIRTADDNYWTQVQLLRDILRHMEPNELALWENIYQSIIIMGISNHCD